MSGIDPTAEVHPTAIIEPGAEIGAGCRIGPYAIIGGEVRLAAGVEVKAHGVVLNRTSVGEGATIHSFAVVGEVPQDLKYAGEATALEIGPRSRVREHATINIGTAGGGGVTRIGADCLIMAGAHVAHDCQIGDRVILVNNSACGGHVVLGDDVILGGMAGVHQWVRVGRGSMIGALTKVTRDVVPFALVDGAHGRILGPNLVGLKRRGASRAAMRALRAAFADLAGAEGSFAERAGRLLGSGEPLVEELAAFVAAASDRQFLVPE